MTIDIDDDAQRIVDSHEAGTTFLVKSGVHDRNFMVRPQDGDTYCGEEGAVLDGGNELEFAFFGEAKHVTLDRLTVQRYNTGPLYGAINPSTHAVGWTVRDVVAKHNYWAGLLAADDMTVLGGKYNSNGQLGIGGNAASRIVIDGVDDDPATLDGPEVAHNRLTHEGCGFEGGGIKWDLGEVIIRNAHVHDNDCKGLWADGNAHDTLIEYNVIEDNAAEGILYEISQDATIRNNRIFGNGLQGIGWLWDGGITITSSFDVDVYGNTLSGNQNGITVHQQDRPEATPPSHRVDDISVHDNIICKTRGEYPVGIASDNGANLNKRDIVFRDNEIRNESCREQ